MKKNVMLASMCVFLVLISAAAQSDELQDLKQKIEKQDETLNTLKKKVKELEGKEKKMSSSIAAATDALAKNTTIGGHFKLFLADFTDGKRTSGQHKDVAQNNNLSAGINEIWFNVNKRLTDWLSMEIVPSVRVASGATPRIGTDITRASTASVGVDIDEAHITAHLPYNIEAKAGALFPYFSEEYAGRAWWHETYHATNGLITLENWQSMGLEIYRNFDLGAVALPVYLYPYLNGLSRSRANDSRFTDNNSAKNMLLHIAPETYLFGSKLRLLGSFGYGIWDDKGNSNSWQYAAGCELSIKKLNILGEYLCKKREDWLLPNGKFADANDSGWYVKGIVTIIPKLKILLKYSEVDLFSPSNNLMLTDNSKTITAAVDYWITEGSTIIPQVEYANFNRSDASESLMYMRYTLGWRTTF